ncbi:ankyrin-1-like [Ceratina calcarata]|uniref:Ankyrin-1-like n=1 Tax=Ceratina calcarata TaxID=156304 RepID=A0AAJ7IVV3_9HYME|nr:ankyrin-1-like [Ceratina calcarata]
MTAAYANDPISQPQQEPCTEKTIVDKTLANKNEQARGESTEFTSPPETMKLATGGQVCEEGLVDQERMPAKSELSESVEEKAKELAEDPEVSENTSENGSDAVERDRNIEADETKSDVLKNCSSTDLIVSARIDDNTPKLEAVSSETRANDSISKDSFKLQELRNSVDSIVTDTSGFSFYETCNGSCEVENLRDDQEESYDPEGELNFHEAVRAGDSKCVAGLLATGSVQNLDEPDWNVSGDPPLLVAATHHCLPILSLLLENGCDPAVRSPRGETALHRVILNGGPGNVYEFVAELLKYGCPPGVKEAGGGLTALHILTRQLAHAQGAKNLHHNFEAALETLDLLARAGPVNAKDHQGRSALHILASSTIFDNNHRTEIESLIETLLAAGADASLKNDRGETPLHECLECGALNTGFLLVAHTPTGIKSRYGETPLHIASRKNYADMVAKLLEHGEDPSVQDAGGNTPLHLASGRGFHQTVSLLVTSPLAQLEKLNTEGLTALQVAAESGFVNAVRLLLKAGADPSQTVHYCTTILHRHPDISVLIDHELSRRRQLAA